MNRPPDTSSAANPKRPKPSFNWPKFLIESAIAIVIFNIIAGIVTYYYLIPRLKH